MGLILFLVLAFQFSLKAAGQSSTATVPANGIQSTQSGSQAPVTSQSSGSTDKEGRSSDVAPARQDSREKLDNKADKDGNNNSREDWSTLQIPRDMEYAAPLPAVVTQFPDFSREFLQMTWRSWDPIDLYVVLPKGIKNPPVILYLYSFPSDSDRFRSEEFAKQATKNGFAAVGFVSALTGHRFHDRPTKEWFVSELQESLVTSVHDVQLVLTYLAKRGDLDMNRVGMFADGSGASIAIMAASVDPRIKALDAFNPWGDWPDWIAQSKLIQIDDERKSYLQPEFLKKVENLDPLKYLPQLKTPQLRLQFVETDNVTPKAVQERLAAAAPKTATVISYESARAFFASGNNKDNLFQWVQEQVVEPETASSGGETRIGDPAKPAPAEHASHN
jgi:hypothetical protein